MCAYTGFGFAPPFLAGVCGVHGSAWVLSCTRHSSLGFWGVCGCVCVPPVPCHSWCGCAVWVCVLGLGFWLCPATPAWGVGLCVCLCARSACTPPLLSGVCGVGVCASGRLSAAPRHSWLGCWGVCVFVCAPRLYPTTPGWGVWCACVCLGSGFSCAPPLLDGVLGSVCVCVRAPLLPRHSWLGCAGWVCVLGLRFGLRAATPCRGAWGVSVFVCSLRLYPATSGWVVRCGCVCLGSGLGWAPPLLAGASGSVCVCVRAPLVPRHSWLGCAVWVCVFWARASAAPRQLAQLALHNPHIWANSLKPVCFLCFLLFWCPLLPFIETGTLKIYTKMILYMKNEIFDLKYPLHGV